MFQSYIGSHKDDPACHHLDGSVLGLASVGRRSLLESENDLVFSGGVASVVPLERVDAVDGAGGSIPQRLHAARGGLDENEGTVKDEAAGLAVGRG
ncbi:hypothetical protein BDP67DRAFT_537341 [Colletotrichum lupini]|nr:hypothetical protein BDP67DRAFT_537341 [Colletotrichum lupini]